MAPPNTRWGNANIQIVAVMPEIAEMLQKAYSKKRIFEHFFAKGCFTMGYRGFCKAMVKHFPESKGKRTVNPPAVANQPAVACKPQSATEVTSVTPQATQQSAPVKRDGPIIVGARQPKPFKVSEITDYRDLV